jgi:predicted MPP superfamily phosphohydrolase
MYRALLLGLLGAMACGSSPSVDPNKFRVVVITDTHVPGPEYVCCTENTDNDNDSIQKSTDRLREVVRRINAIEPRPDLVFVMGDVTHNPYHSQDRAHYDTAHTAFTDVKDILGGLEMPYHLALGNHDYGIDCNNEYVSHDFTAGLFRDFLATEPYHAVDWKGWRFILGNSQLGPTWDATGPDCNTEVASYGAEQLAWIDSQLSDGTPATFLSHYPLFATKQNEDPNGPNPDLMTVFARHDSLKLSLAGHLHLWLDMLTQYSAPVYILGGTRYDDDNFWVIEFDPPHGTFEILDHDKGRHGTTCANTWSYDGTPKLVMPQPDEDGSCN